MTDTFSIQIHNRKLFEQNQPGEWLKLPATTEQLHAAMQRIGITANNQQDFFINGIESPVEAVARLTLENVQAASIDELNFLAAKLEELDPSETEKLNVNGDILSYWDDVHHLTEYATNTDFFVYIPGVTNHAELGDYYLNKSQMVQIPEEWKAAVDVERLGTLAAEQENGLFINNGYILESGDEWQPVNEIPQEYRIMSFPQPEQDRQNIDYDDMPATAIAPELTQEQPPQEPQPVIPIVLDSEKPTDKLKEITDRLETGIADIFSSEQYQDYLNTLSKFHNYSLNNTILIAMQKPDASHIAGYGAWKKDFERQVKKGEKGIKIIAPSPFKVKKEMDKIDPGTGRPVIGADGRAVTEEVEVKIPAFKVVSVFDVSQTEGKELPTIGANNLTGDVEQYKDFFAALEKVSPVPIAFENIEGSANGYYHQVDKRIAIDEGMSELQTLKTTIHEIAHAQLHDIEKEKGEGEPPRADRRTREVEAESIAYTVCQHYGLDTSDYSFGYVAGWSSGKELVELKASLETIRTAAAELITEIDGHFEELQQDREQTAEHEQQPNFEETATATIENAPENPSIPSDNINTHLPEQDEPPTATYYSINENAARQAKQANSFYDYKPGSATAEYKQNVDEIVDIAERHKSRVDPMYHEKIDHLVDTYARKLAENMNKSFSIESRVPSIMIAGPSNFPVRQKEKQNAARHSNMEEWRYIQGLRDKIQSVGMGGISADDPNATKKLQDKLTGLEQSQETMKTANAYYRKHKTLDGCPVLSAEQIQKLTADMQTRWYGRVATKPFEAYALQNNNAEINRLKGRIADLTRRSETDYVGWQFDGGKVEANKQDNRLQVFFEDKPDEDTRKELKSNGFRWAPTAGAWQRQLNNNSFRAANNVKSIQPLTGERPTDLQKKGHAEAVQPMEHEQSELQGKTDTFSIYQLKDGDSTRDFRFEPLDHLHEKGLVIEPGNYEFIYTAPISEETASLDNIFHKFNIDHPEDYTGRSLSVSDIVTLNHNGEETAHYVDSFGFKEMPEFLQPTPEPELAPNQHIENIDGVDFVFTTVMPQEPEKTQDNHFETKAASRSNYKDMVALMGADGNVYIGKSDNYHFISSVQMPWHEQGQEYGDRASCYDNSDNSLIYVSDNQQMFGFISGDGWVSSQSEMIDKGYFTKGDYKEFERIQTEVVNGLPYKDNFTGIQFGDKPFEPSENPIAAAEMSEEQNYNMIDGIPNNRPTVDELEKQVNAGETISLYDLAAAIKTDKAAKRDTSEKPSIRAQLKAAKETERSKPPQDNVKKFFNDLEV